MRKLLVINSLSGVIQIFVGMFLVFFTIPVFIDKLGSELFGIYSLLLLIGNLNSLTNLGLNSSLIKFISEQGKSVESDYDIIVSFSILFTIVVIISAFAFFFRQFIMSDVFAIKDTFINKETIWLYNSLIISNIIMFIGQIGIAVLDALQKIYLTNLLQFIYNILYWGLMLFVLFFFSNLQFIGLSIVLASIVWFTLVLLSVLKYWGSPQYIGIRNHFPRVLKKNFSYGIKIYTSSILNFLFEPLSKILLSNFVGVKEVGLFDIVLRIRTQIWNILSKFLYPLLPYISKEKNFAKIKYFITDIEQKLVFLILPILILIVFGANPFVQLWIGRDVELISNGIILLVPAHLAGLLLFPNYQFLMVKGYPGKTIVLQAVNSIVNILCFFILINFYNYYSIIIANFIAMIISTLVNMYYQKKYLDSYIFNNFYNFLKWNILFIVLCLTGILIKTTIDNEIYRISALLVVIPIVSVFCFRILKVFTGEDMKRYMGFNKTLLKFINKLVLNS